MTKTKHAQNEGKKPTQKDKYAMSNGCSVGNKLVSDLGKRLLEAARLGNTDEVTSLMSNGAPLTTDWLGTTPLHLASIYGHASTAEILIKSGISKDGRTKVDKAPLHFACQHGHFDVVKLLVNGGAHIDAMDMLNMTPLHWAVEAKSFDICLFLLKAGVKTGVKNKFDKTALDIARSNGYEPIKKLLSDEKFRVLQEIDVLHHNALKDRHISSVKICKADNLCSSNYYMAKKQKTRRFPMAAGTWTGGEAQTQERFEISERKRLGVYKRRQYQQRDVLANSLLQNLQSAKISSSAANNTKPDDKSTSNSLYSTTSTAVDYENESPLLKLEQTVRLSTHSNSSANNKPDTAKSYDDFDEKVSVKVSSSSLLLSLPHTSIEIPFVPPRLPLISSSCTTSSELTFSNRIPIISADSFDKLPDGVQAIPLDMTVEELEMQQIENTTLQCPMAERASNSAFNPNRTRSHHLATTPVHLPINLLNQINDGDITLHTLKNKTIDDGCIEKLAGITTEMGIIPLVPVSDEGGLALIPVENTLSVTPPQSPQRVIERSIRSQIKKEDDRVIDEDHQDYGATSSVPTSMSFSVPQMMPSVLFPPIMTQSVGGGATNLSMLAAHHGGFDIANAAILASRQGETGRYLNGTIPANLQSVLMPAGVFLHPGHPSLVPVPNQHVLYPQHTQSFMQPSFLPSLHSSIAHPFVQPSMQPVFHGQPPILNRALPQYFYVERSGSNVMPHQVAHLAYDSIVRSSQNASQEPDSST